MKIPATRRRFLAFLGAAPAAPIAAKAALQQQMADLSGVSLKSVAIPPAPYYGLPVSGGDEESAIDAASRYVSVFGIPEYVENDYIRRSRAVDSLDPDLVIKCWSWNVKIQEQRRRNLARMKEGLTNEIAQTARRKAFRQIAGFSWPFYG